MKKYFIIYKFLGNGGVEFERGEVRTINFDRETILGVEKQIAKELGVRCVQVKSCNKV